MSNRNATSHRLTSDEQIRYAKEVIQTEARALEDLAQHLDTEICRAIELLYECRGNVILTGMGKAGLIGQKLVATLASTGTRSHFLHPSEAVHGDLGRVHTDDVVIVLSQSGETEEIVRLLPMLRSFEIPLIAMTGRRTSTLARSATVLIDLGDLEEACALGLAPSTSTTAMLAVGDALALVTSRMRGFRPEDFARFHPAGSLGRKLSYVEDHMRPLADCRVASVSESVREILVRHSHGGRRTGAIMLTDQGGALVGIFTDSDLARLLEEHRDAAIDAPAADVMTSQPYTVTRGTRMQDAVTVMAQRKISELPVIDDDQKPVGMIDITDIMSLFPDLQDNRTRPTPKTPSVGPPPPKHPLFRTHPSQRESA